MVLTPILEVPGPLLPGFLLRDISLGTFRAGQKNESNWAPALELQWVMGQLPFLFTMNMQWDCILLLKHPRGSALNGLQASLMIAKSLFRVKRYSLVIHLVNSTQQDKTNIKQTHRHVHAPPLLHRLLLRPSLGIICLIICTYWGPRRGH